MPTAAEVQAALQATRAVADAIRELGEVPAGHLYAHLMGHMSLDTFEAIIGVLQRTKLVERDSSHMLRWVGPPAQGVGA